MPRLDASAPMEPEGKQAKQPLNSPKTAKFSVSRDSPPIILKALPLGESYSGVAQVKSLDGMR